jgi:hypothetical protein
MANDNILRLIANVQAELKAPKSQYNSFGRYNYRSAEDILEAVKPLLFKHGLTQTISDEVVETNTRHYIKATVTVYLGDQSVSVSAFAREPEQKKGMDESQITGTASSYARKYALNGMWCIDDTKEADTDEFRQQTDKQNNGKANKKSEPVDDDRLPWDMDEDESEYLTKKEVGDLVQYAVRALGKDDAEACIRKMCTHYKVSSETLLRADTSLYYGYIDKWGESNVNAGKG